MRINILNTKGFSERELKKLSQATCVLQKIVSSPRFKEEILSREYKYTNLTPLQIWETIEKGIEIGTTEADNEIDIDITIYNSGWFGRRTVGYTYGYTLKTWINRRFFSIFSDESIAGNLLHEWLHNLGFGHPFKSTSDRHLSVPYQMNSIVKKLYKEIFG